jgi:hypothetical protein
VVGAGTGNDVQAALRHGYSAVYSVDIDGRIIDLGRRFHPEHPYDDPRAIRWSTTPALSSSSTGAPFRCRLLRLQFQRCSPRSSLRLDNYVYTEEGIRSAWRHVSTAGT